MHVYLTDIFPNRFTFLVMLGLFNRRQILNFLIASISQLYRPCNRDQLFTSLCSRLDINFYLHLHRSSFVVRIWLYSFWVSWASIYLCSRFYWYFIEVPHVRARMFWQLSILFFQIMQIYFGYLLVYLFCVCALFFSTTSSNCWTFSWITRRNLSNMTHWITGWAFLFKSSLFRVLIQPFLTVVFTWKWYLKLRSCMDILSFLHS